MENTGLAYQAYKLEKDEEAINWLCERISELDKYTTKIIMDFNLYTCLYRYSQLDNDSNSNEIKNVILLKSKENTLILKYVYNYGKFINDLAVQIDQCMINGKMVYCAGNLSKISSVARLGMKSEYININGDNYELGVVGKEWRLSFKKITKRR